MEIQVGEYVRTKGGYIAKVLDVRKRSSIISRCDGRKITYQPRYWIDNKSGSVAKPYIVNHSFNIIDLIEEGDYVNGDKITYINQDPFIKGQINLWTDKNELNCFGDSSRIKYLSEDIKSIVTKEMFESMSYKAGD